jgi:hypothetical protein
MKKVREQSSEAEQEEEEGKVPPEVKSKNAIYNLISENILNLQPL